jgi:hypothetical protein
VTHYGPPAPGAGGGEEPWPRRLQELAENAAKKAVDGYKERQKERESRKRERDDKAREDREVMLRVEVGRLREIEGDLRKQLDAATAAAATAEQGRVDAVAAAAAAIARAEAAEAAKATAEKVTENVFALANKDKGSPSKSAPSPSPDK